MCPKTSQIIGYSELQDKVIQYPVELTIKDKGKTTIQTTYWIDYLFTEKPQTPGNWKYETDYRGRAATLDRYEIHYSKQAENFEGDFSSTEGN